MATTTPTFIANITSEAEGGKQIALTWPALSGVIDREFNVDLVLGTNTVNFSLSAGDPAAQMLIIIPPTTNAQTIKIATGNGINIHPKRPTILSLDPQAATTSITLVADGTINGVRILLL